MKYRDALELSLDAAREEEDIERASAAFPEHADRLRTDVALAVALRRHADTLPDAPVEASTRALAALEGELRSVRQERFAETARPPTGSFLRLPRFAPALVTLLLLVSLGAVGALAVGTGALGGVSKAEALTYEGIVVESADGYLLLQTASELEQIKVPSDAKLVSSGGSSLKGISAGQAVVVTARRARSGPVTATRVQLQAVETVEAWCDESLARCQQLEERLEQGLEACPQRPEACAEQRARLETIRARVAVAVRLAALKERCRNGELLACRELVELCRAQNEACAGIERRLLEPAEAPSPVLPAPVEEERLEGVRLACQQGVALACVELRQLCETHPLLCPQRPAPSITPQPARVEPVEAPVRVETNEAPAPRVLPASPPTSTPPARPTPTVAPPRQGPPPAQPPAPQRQQPSSGR